MSNRKFAVIGHPIGHTMSPFIHKRLFELAGAEGEYTVIDVAPQDLPEKIHELNELDGYNITIPNKQRIIPYLDRLDPKAELYGSVNTVKNSSIREGYTTDPNGFLKALSSAGIPFEGRVCIIGRGGAARTFVYEAALAGCDITIAVRPKDGSICKELEDEVRNKINGAKVSTCLISEIEENEMYFDLLANATPVGMYPNIDRMPVSEKVISRSKNVFDAVYNPLETKLIRTAKALGIKALGGMDMLVWQAVAAHEIWDGSVYRTEDISALVTESAEEMKRMFCR